MPVKRFFWDWIRFNNKYAGKCEICDSGIPKGTTCMWKKGSGIVHANCILKYEKLLEKKDEALTYFNFNKVDKGNETLKEIHKISLEINQNAFSEKLLGKNNYEDVKNLINSIKNKKELRDAAKKSKRSFIIKVKKRIERWFDQKRPEIPEGITQLEVVLQNLKKNPEMNQTKIDQAESKLRQIKKMQNQRLLEIIEILYDELRNKGQYLFEPKSPVENIQDYKKLINEAEKKIYIIDKYFNKNSLELLLHTLEWEKTDVVEIKILTSKIHLKNQINDRFKKLFQNIKRELTEDYEPSIDIQMKVIVDEELNNEIHSRYFLSSNPDNSFDIGSKEYVFEQTNTITRLNDVDGDKTIKFDEWWNHSGALDILKNWKKIQNNYEQHGISNITKKVSNKVDNAVYSTEILTCHICKKQFSRYSNWKGPNIKCKDCLLSVNRKN